jgi:hypothetical protein
MSALLPVGSTIRKLALDVLRSGKAFEPDGVKHFKKLYKTFEGASAPDEVVSEFRRVVDALYAPSIANHIYNTRVARNFEISNPLDAALKPGPIPGPYTINARKRQESKFNQMAEEVKQEAFEAGFPAYGPGRRASGNNLLSEMQLRRYDATRERSEAQLYEALRRLFGESL